MLHLALSGLGTVEPIGDPQLRQHILRHFGDAGLGHFRFPVGLQLGVLFLDAGADSSHTLQGELGDRTLFFWYRRQDFLGTCLAGAETLRLWPLRNLGRCFEIRLLGAVGPLTLVTVTATIGSVAATAAIVAVTSAATSFTVVALTFAATAASFTVAAASLASAALGFCFDNGLEWLVVGQHLDEATTFVLLASLDDRQDFYPIEHLFGFNLDDVADRCVVGKDRTIHRAFRLEGSGCAPCPRTV